MVQNKELVLGQSCRDAGMGNQTPGLVTLADCTTVSTRDHGHGQSFCPFLPARVERTERIKTDPVTAFTMLIVDSKHTLAKI